MEQERLILKKLREQNELSLDAAVKLIERSKGWLSEIENNKGRSILRPREYQRIYQLYNGDKYKRYFGSWVKLAFAPKTSQSAIFEIKQIFFCNFKFIKYSQTKKSKHNYCFC